MMSVKKLMLYLSSNTKKWINSHYFYSRKYYINKYIDSTTPMFLKTFKIGLKSTASSKNRCLNFIFNNNSTQIQLLCLHRIRLSTPNDMLKWLTTTRVICVLIFKRMFTFDRHLFVYNQLRRIINIWTGISTLRVFNLNPEKKKCKPNN